MKPEYNPALIKLGKRCEFHIQRVVVPKRITSYKQRMGGKAQRNVTRVQVGKGLCQEFYPRFAPYLPCLVKTLLAKACGNGPFTKPAPIPIKIDGRIGKIISGDHHHSHLLERIFKNRSLHYIAGTGADEGGQVNEEQP